MLGACSSWKATADVTTRCHDVISNQSECANACDQPITGEFETGVARYANIQTGSNRSWSGSRLYFVPSYVKELRKGNKYFVYFTKYLFSWNRVLNLVSIFSKRSLSFFCWIKSQLHRNNGDCIYCNLLQLPSSSVPKLLCRFLTSESHNYTG